LVDFSPVESTGVHWSPPEHLNSGRVQLDSTGLHRTPPDSTGPAIRWSPVDWSTGLDSTGLHRTISPVVWVVQQLIWLGTQSTGVQMSLPESAGVQPDYVGER